MGKKNSVTVCQNRFAHLFNREEYFFSSGIERLLNPNHRRQQSFKVSVFSIVSKPKRLHSALGRPNVHAAKRISDGSVVYDVADGLHIYAGYEEGLFSEITKEKRIEVIHELPDGALAAIGRRTIQIFRVVLTEKRYQLELDRGLRAIQELDFQSAVRAYQMVKKLCPDNKRHQVVYLEALAVLRREKYRSDSKDLQMYQAKCLLEQVEKDVGIPSLSGRRYHKYLIVGDGDLTFSEALVNKHPDIAEHLVATELYHPLESAQSKVSQLKGQSQEIRGLHKDMEKRSLKKIEERVAYLKGLGVRVLFGINAKQVNKEIPGEHFHRI